MDLPIPLRIAVALGSAHQSGPGRFSSQHGALSVPVFFRWRCVHLLPILSFRMEFQTLRPAPAVASAPPREVPVVVNEMRLSAGHWLVVAVILWVVAIGVPKVWKRIERFDVGPDYRIPYSLSKDYWLYQRRL